MTVKRHRWAAVAASAALLCLLAASCSSASPPAPEEPAVESLKSGAQATAEGPVAEEPVAENLSSTVQKPPTGVPDIVHEEHAVPEKEEEEKMPNATVQPTYRMNKAYRFEPLPQAGEAEQNKVALLTFDDGPKEAALLAQLLETLDKHQAKAIFFVNGYRVEANPQLLQEVAEQGHAIGNHAWDHIDLKKADSEEAGRQIRSVQQQVEALIGEAPRFFRPPFGSGGDAVRQLAAAENLLYMTWSVGALDWDKQATNNPDFVKQTVLEQLHNGANILMHELQWTADALDELLTEMRSQGYSFLDPKLIEWQYDPYLVNEE